MLRATSSTSLRAAHRATFQVSNELGHRTLSYSRPSYATPVSPSSSRAPQSSSQPSVSSVNENTPENATQHSPTTVALVKGFAWMLGYKSKASTAIRETRDTYSHCAARDTQEAHFIHIQCQLSPTYQTWFQIANLHVWLVRTRYRALPASHGKIYDQELVNHFFLDVEDRMRVALNHKAPERIVKGYMKEMRDQWTGATFSYDLGLVGSDAELSGAVWRNIFASRGLDGKGEVIGKPGKVGESRPVQTEQSDEEIPATNAHLSDATLAELPFHLYIFTSYIRRELRRLEALSDEQVIAGDIGQFGSFESHILAAERDFAMEMEERKLLGLEEDVPAKSSIPKVKRRVAAA